MHTLQLTLLIIIILVLVIWLLNSCSPSVENFGEKNKLVLYYTEWCGHSRDFIKNVWNNFSAYARANYADKLDVYKIDCDKNKDKCAQISGYPTVILHTPSKNITFDQARSFDSLVSFVNANI